MAELFGRRWTKRELLERVGDVSQLGGARPVRLEDGPEDGVQAVEVRTGSGFAFTVLPGRGMDLGFAEFNGAPLCWRSAETSARANCQRIAALPCCLLCLRARFYNTCRARSTAPELHSHKQEATCRHSEP